MPHAVPDARQRRSDARTWKPPNGCVALSCAAMHGGAHRKETTSMTPDLTCLTTDGNRDPRPQRLARRSMTAGRPRADGVRASTLRQPVAHGGSRRRPCRRRDRPPRRQRLSARGTAGADACRRQPDRGRDVGTVHEMNAAHAAEFERVTKRGGARAPRREQRGRRSSDPDTQRRGSRSGRNRIALRGRRADVPVHARGPRRAAQLSPPGTVARHARALAYAAEDAAEPRPSASVVRAS